MNIVTSQHIRSLIRETGLREFNRRLIACIEEDFLRWEQFHKSPRHAFHYPHGVMELMPWADDEIYTFKYVNGHPRNTAEGKLSVAAIGMLAEVKTGYPLMLCEMTVATALRTAAVAAVGSRFLSKGNSRRLAIIGCGAQSEFMVQAIRAVRNIETVCYFDIDSSAMGKFAGHLKDEPLELHAAANVLDAIRDADIIVTATNSKSKKRLFASDRISGGVHIHGAGGDCPGKTELDPDILLRSKVVVEYLEQCRSEGEIQNLPEARVHAELWEVVSGAKPGRENGEEITVLDSVGIALADFSTLRLIRRICEERRLGDETALIPALKNPKDLYGFLVSD